LARVLPTSAGTFSASLATALPLGSNSSPRLKEGALDSHNENFSARLVGARQSGPCQIMAGSSSVRSGWVVEADRVLSTSEAAWQPQTEN